MARRRGRFSHNHVQAIERGDTFDQWTLAVGGGGTFDRATPSYFAYAIQWRNNGGTATGSASWRLPLTLTAPNYNHMVHMVLHEGNSTASVPMGPGTAINGSNTPKDGYYARAYFNAATGVYYGPRFAVGIASGGTLTDLFSSGGEFQPGDVLSLGYSYDGAGTVTITAYKNGASIASITHSSSPYVMSSSSYRPGIYGFNTKTTSSTTGARTDSWWVTIGDADNYHEIRAKDFNTAGHLACQLSTFQRYTDSDDPVVKRIFTKNLISAKWEWNRTGGCGSGTFKIRYAPDHESLGDMFDVPTFDDWNDSSWIGGLFQVLVKSDSRCFGEIGAEASTWTVYTGRVRKVDYDSETKVIKISTQGLFSVLDEHFLYKDYTDVTVKDILLDLMQYVVKSSEASGVDSYIVGHTLEFPPGFLEQTITVEFKNESLKSVIERLMAFAPNTLTYGVDREGKFFTHPQLSVAEDDSSGLTYLWMMADKEAVSYSRTIDISKVKTWVACLGEKDETTGEQISGSAICDRGRRLFGKRGKFISGTSINDAGMAAKLAQAEAKRLVSVDIRGSMKMVSRFGKGRTFFHTYLPYAPAMSISSWDPSETVDGPTPGTEHRPNIMRLYGDVAGMAVRGAGRSGGYLEGTFSEQVNAAWLIGVTLKFTTAHNGASNEYVFGAAHNSSFTGGFGSLIWYTSGALYWSIDTTGGAVAIPTGITVSSTPTTVYLTIYRDPAGKFWFYNGAVNTSSYASTATLTTASYKWRFFKHQYGATSLGWNGDFDNFHMIDTEVDGGVEDVGIANWLLYQQQKRLRRNQCRGLMLWVPGNHYTNTGSTTSVKAWRNQIKAAIDRGAVEDWTLDRTGSSGDPTALSENNRRGNLIGTEQRWGGPLLRDPERVSYEVIPADAVMIMDLELGGRENNLAYSVAAITEENRVQNELLNKLRGE